MTCYEGRRAVQAPKHWRSVKKIKITERKGIRIFLSPAEQAAYHSTIILLDPSYCLCQLQLWKWSLLFRLRANDSSVSEAALQVRPWDIEEGQCGEGDISLEELLRLPAAFIQFDKRPCAGVNAFSSSLLQLWLYSDASHLGADGQWQCKNRFCAVHDPFCIWRRSLTRKKVAIQIQQWPCLMGQALKSKGTWKTDG